MLAKVFSSSISGVDANKVEVEARVENNEKEKFIIIGLADSTVRESKERVVSALKSYGINLPKKIIINLAPAEIPKEGACLDLAIAISLLVAKGLINQDKIIDTSFHGELSLNGEIKKNRGTIAQIIEDKKNKIKKAFVPAENFREASLIKDMEIIPVRTLKDVIDYINNNKIITIENETNQFVEKNLLSLNDVWGQDIAKEAIIICATGGHNLLMIGSPGCGKSMLAKRIPSILPKLTPREILDSVKIHSIANQNILSILQGQAPYRSPHHNISEVGLAGGGSNPAPGEISLAHNGVLFLDEFPEFKRSALESLRAPIENGYINISRSKAKIFLPAKFMLIAAMNPCPCGFFLSRSQTCRCSTAQVLNYLNKISGPIIDRIDLQVEMEEIDLVKASKENQKSKMDLEKMKEKITNARKIQFDRQKKLNNMLSGKELISPNHISKEALDYVLEKSRALKISARSYVKILKVARTIADLEQKELIDKHHIAHAFEFRKLDNIRKSIEKRAGFL